jgi:hypothetical protein
MLLLKRNVRLSPLHIMGLLFVTVLATSSLTYAFHPSFMELACYIEGDIFGVLDSKFCSKVSTDILYEAVHLLSELEQTGNYEGDSVSELKLKLMILDERLTPILENTKYYVIPSSK